MYLLYAAIITVFSSESNKSDVNADKRYLAIVKFIVALLSILLVSSYLTGFLSPEEWSGWALMALSYPFFLALNVVTTLVLLLTKLRKLVWMTLLSILVTSGSAYSVLQFSVGEEEGFSVVSANVRSFNKYGYLRGSGYGKCKESMADITALKSDIVCIQEYFEWPGDSVFRFPELMGSDYYQSLSVAHEDRRGGLFGISIYSRYPIVSEGTIVFDSTGNSAQWADLVMDHDTLRVYNVHLQSVHVRDRELVEAIGETQMNKRDSVEFLDKMKWAFRKRAKQTDKVIKHAQGSPHPALVVGDFNDTQFSYTYHSFAGYWKNAFEDEGVGLGGTIHKEGYPSVRIDNQFFDDSVLDCNAFEVLTSCKNSDHYPIKGYYSWE